ncbi:MAG: MBL fold metallo-hydrolase [Acidobacteria bacterium]|nr:MAG: MBL fold metallo-hydrolase [Acidobacteriota bacterium]
MRLSERVYLVGGGTLGFSLSEEHDCHVYVIDGGSALTLIDAGAGITIEPILQNMRFDGLDPQRLNYLILTHAHSDHAGAACEWRNRFGVEVVASREAAEYLSKGDEERVSLSIAKKGGFYPDDYVFRACPVAHILKEEDVFRIGDIELRVLETPGHCSGMLSLILNEGGRAILFPGDTVFHDGKLLMTNVWDCDLQLYARSIEKLARQKVDSLLPGHLTIAMQHGDRHIQKAWNTLERLSLPPNII